MAAADVIHDVVKNALVKDGWSITHDPYVIKYEEARLFADLGAERPLAAAKAERKLVVEAKSFRNPSPIHDFEVALGQYLVYRAFLEVVAPEHELYLAVGNRVYANLFQQSAIQLVVQRYQVALLVVHLEREEIVAWKN
jgi:hypothetical protein